MPRAAAARLPAGRSPLVSAKLACTPRYRYADCKSIARQGNRREARPSHIAQPPLVGSRRFPSASSALPHSGGYCRARPQPSAKSAAASRLSMPHWTLNVALSRASPRPMQLTTMSRSLILRQSADPKPAREHPWRHRIRLTRRAFCFAVLNAGVGKAPTVALGRGETWTAQISAACSTFH
jgi:hypothetical protein